MKYFWMLWLGGFFSGIGITLVTLSCLGII